MRNIAQKKKNLATFIGCCGLFLWTMAATLTAFVKQIPTFQLLSITFGICFVSTCVYLSFTHQWSKLKQPLMLWIVGILCFSATNIFYVYAFQNAPEEQADLIIYLWPLLTVLFSGLLPKEKFVLKHLLAALLGFLGTYLLITKGQGLSAFQIKYLPGYLFALVAALSWTVYTLISRLYGKTPPEAIGIYCGFAMLFCLTAHSQFETSISLSSTQWLTLTLMGFTTHGLAYFLWDFGIGRGNFKLLGVLSYANPIFSITFLILFGFAEASFWLFLACVLVASSGLIASISWGPHLKQLYKTYQKILKPAKKPTKYPLILKSIQNSSSAKTIGTS